MPSRPRDRRNRGIQLVLVAIAMEALLIWMHTLADLRLYVVETIAILLATSLFYIVSVWLLLKTSGGGGESAPLLLVFAAAIVFRISLVSLNPAFSQDIYRYRWEGKMQAHGYNPYGTRPDDPRLEPLRDSVYGRIANPDLPAVYGPLLEAMERLTYRLVSSLSADPVVQILWFKLPAMLADLGTAIALCALLKAKGLPLNRVLIYLWCPLPIFEFWVSGHNDAVLVLLLTVALAFAARGGRVAASTALALAAAAKFWPVLLLPSFTGWKWRRMAQACAVLALTSAALFFPYRGDLIYNARLTSGFLGGWRNNDSLHGVVAALTSGPYMAKYVTTALIAAAAILISRLRWTLEARTLTCIAAMLALSANVHPWYLTWMIPLLALYPIPALLLWTALMPVTYAVLIQWTRLGEWNGVTGWRWLVYIPVAAMLAASLALHRRTPLNSSPSSRPRS